MTRTAAGVPGLALAGLAFDAPAGVRAYADPPDIQDRVERGEVTGSRTDRVTYVFERAGRFAIPAVAQPWWDLQGGRPHTLTLPSRIVEVAAGPAAPATSKVAWPVIAAVLLLLAAAGYFGRAAFVAWQTVRRNGAAHVERTAFRALRRASREADAAATYRAWRDWNAARPGDTLPPELAAAVAPLEASLFGHAPAWTAANADRLVAAAAKARRTRRASPRRSGLPPLNPDTESAR